MKKKFNLNDLKVKSFVTSMENGEEHTVKGGGTLVIGCTGVIACGGTLPPPTNNTTCCLDTKVEAICKGWHTMPYWDGCGSINPGF